jgi:hypothetical protein
MKRVPAGGENFPRRKFLPWWCGLAINLAAALLVIAAGAVFLKTGAVSAHGPDSTVDRGPAPGILVISDTGSGRVYGAWPLEGDGEFSVEFIHSVNQSPVRDTFRAEAGRIRPAAAKFYSFGAGIQTGLEDGQTLTREGDAMIITGFKISFPEINYIVGTVSDHILFVNHERVSLRNLCGRNAHITMRIR